MSSGGPLVPQQAPKSEKNSNIERTASLALMMKKCHANPGVNWTENGAATTAFIKHKCYSFTIIMYYINIIKSRSTASTQLSAYAD